MKIINNLSITLILLLIGMVSCQKDRYIQGSGKIDTEFRVLNGFTGVSSEGDFEVYIDTASYFEIKVEADRNFMPYVSTIINGKTLVIRTLNNKIFEDSEPVRVFIKVPYISYVSLSGSGLLACDNAYNLNTEVNLSGSGDISMFNLDTESINAKVSGSGQIELQGLATVGKFSISGSGRIKGYSVKTRSQPNGRLEIKHCEISISGSGDAFVWIWDFLDVNISGSGIVYYRGNPKILNYQIPGSGDVRNDN